MRPIVLALLAAAAATPSLAQTADRYGGYTASQPRQTAAPRVSGRILSWPGKTIPMAAQPQPAPYPARPVPAPQAWQGAPPANGYAPAPVPGQRPMATSYPSPYQPQPYYAPAPGAPAPAPGSTATAPEGVYPQNTVPPQYAHPMAVPPQYSTPLVTTPQPPASIYAPPPPRPAPTGAAAPARPQKQLAAASAAQSARYYSLHRQFGLHPDPTPEPTPAGETVELVSSIDGAGMDRPETETRPRTVAIKDKSGKTVQLRRLADDQDPN